MSYSAILFQVEESGIALLTVNRPEKLNALSSVVIGELGDAFGRVASDPAIRAAIVTGAGEKAFVAGADIRELAELSPYDARVSMLRGQAVLRQLETCGKPSVAAVNGFALGGGLELAMACTVRFASENAKFGQPEVKLGIIPGYGGTQRLPRLVGRGRALEMLLAGDPIPAAEAYRIGLVNAVVPQAELLEHCRGLAGQSAGQRSAGARAGYGRGGHRAGRAGWRKGCGLRPRHSQSPRRRKIAKRVCARFSRNGAPCLQGSEICRKSLKANYRRRGCALRLS